MADERHRTTKPYHHGNLREALLRAARDLLRAKGAAHVSLRDIARQTGVSAPAAYHYFASREALLLALIDIGIKELIEAITLARPQGLKASGLAYIRFVRDNPALYRLMYGETLSLDSGYAEASKSIREEAKAATVRLLTATEARALDPVAALYLWSLVHGLGLLLADGHVAQHVSADQLAEKVLALARQGLSAVDSGQG